MKKKNVLITGCNRGIGRAILEKYQNENYNIFGLGKKKFSNICKRYYSVDLSDINEVQEFCKKLKNLKIDILINNAGINKIDKFHLVKQSDLGLIFQVNFFSIHRICQSVIPNMIKNKWGRIVNLTSIFGSVVKEKRSSYSSTKFALNGLTKTLAAEYSRNNILTNAVAPGVIETELTRKILKKNIHKIKKDIPMGKLGSVDEVSNIVKWLGSEKNTFITGQQIIVDGGYTIV